MRRGLTLPIFDALADPRLLAELAAEAEAAGWEGFFVWDHVYYREPVRAVTDPWVALAAAAMATQRIALGPMVTPLARRRVQVLARQVVALDHLSGGRVVLGVGLGLDTSGGEFARFGEEPDVRIRAARYDESLALLGALLSGERVDHDGTYLQARGVRFLPAPVRGRIPVWVAGRWPNRAPLRRAARHDGVFAIDLQRTDVPALRAEISGIRGEVDGFDIVVQTTADDDPAPWEDAGADWLLTTFDAFTTTPAQVRTAIAAGPRG